MTEPARPGTRSRANTRARLLEAALGVFAEKGLAGATVDDLAGAAGFTRGAFYSNFSSKEDVFYALYADLTQRMVQLVRETVSSVPAGTLDVAVLREVLDRLRPFAREWYLIQTEFVLHALRHGAVADRFLEQRGCFGHEFADVILEALRRLGRRPTVPAEDLADVLASMYLKHLAEEAVADAHGRRPGGPASDRSFVDVTLPAVLLGLSEPADA